MAVTAQWLFYNYTMIENYTFLRNESQPLKFLYFLYVFSAKSPFVKLSIRQTFRSTKFPFDKVSVGKMSVRQNVFRQNVFWQSVFRQNVRVPKSKGTICRVSSSPWTQSGIVASSSDFYLNCLAKISTFKF